eukprot:744219-Prorocentrum_minimum.AAC.3
MVQTRNVSLSRIRGRSTSRGFLDVARPPSRDPPPGDRSLRSDGPEIRPGVSGRPGLKRQGGQALAGLAARARPGPPWPGLAARPGHQAKTLKPGRKTNHS